MEEFNYLRTTLTYKNSIQEEIKSRLKSGNACYHSVQNLLSSSFHSFNHSIGMCRMRQFLAILRSFFHFSLLYTLSFHPFQPSSLPFSLTSSCHLFLGLPLSLVASKFIHNTLFGNSILFHSLYMPKPM